MSDPAPAQIRRALIRAERGTTLNAAEVATLLAARGPSLRHLMTVAGVVRDARLRSERRPGVVTFSPKVFVPLTRLCRDRCHYCTFATDPASLRRAGQPLFLGIDEVVDLSRRGVDAGCREVLFTLGDQPEARWPAAREWLDQAGYDSTLDYVRAAAIAVLESTGALPHLNPGVMGWAQMQRLRPVAPSMGLMLETSSTRLHTEPGQVHFGSPDKDPALRLRTIADAGRQAIPFTSGVLVGIGETREELAQSLLDLRRLSLEFDHLQEVIVQNFRAKPDTAASQREDLRHEDYLAAIATARLVMPVGVSLQAPPNLSDVEQIPDLLGAGVDDFGGVSPVTIDHVNPERPWPAREALDKASAAAGFQLLPRLTVHPRYVRRAGSWIDPQVRPFVDALADDDGMAGPNPPKAMVWQAPEDTGGYRAFARANAGGRVDLNRTIDLIGRTETTRSDFDSVYGDWGVVRQQAQSSGSGSRGPEGSTRIVAEALRLAASDPATLAEAESDPLAVALMQCEGDALEELCRTADRLRADVVGDEITYVVNRNINFTNVCYTGCRFCAFAQRESDPDAFTLSLDEVAERAREAVEAGATEVCMQGGIHPRLPGEAYFDLVGAIAGAAPELHVHAFSPMEVVNGASKAGLSVREWLRNARDAGLSSIPGTAAEILDDEVRWVLTKGKLPTSEWIDVVSTAHSLGLPSSATMMYGHVDHPRHWVAHLRTLRSIQERTGGFTEFVPLPFVHGNAPIYLAGAARPGPTARDNLAVHAMARVMLHGAIDHIQTSWVKLGVEGAATMLNAGADDMGGTLMEETISRMAGSEHGSSMTVDQLHEIAALAGRSPRQRTTLYRPVASPIAAVI